LIELGTQTIAKRVKAGDLELGDRAIIAAFGEAVRIQQNRERIAEYAADELEAEAATSDAKSEIADDWLNTFSQHAGRVSNDDMQRLWARVLAGEIRQPGTFKLRTLQALSVLEAQEAQLVHDHMNLVINGKSLYVGPGTKLASFGDLLELESIGVVQGIGSPLSLTIPVSPQLPGILHLASNHTILIHSDTPQSLTLGNVCALTPFGRELVKLARPQAFKEGLPELVAKSIVKEGLTIDLVDVVMAADLKSFEYTLQRRLEPQ
jgi:hypothetical protein